MGSVILLKTWSHPSPWDSLVPPVVCLQQNSVSALLTSGWDEAHQNQKSSEGYKKRKGVSGGEVFSVMAEGCLLEHSKEQGKDKDLPLLPPGAGQQEQVSHVQRFHMHKVQFSGGHQSFQA